MKKILFIILLFVVACNENVNESIDEEILIKDTLEYLIHENNLNSQNSFPLIITLHGAARTSNKESAELFFINLIKPAFANYSSIILAPILKDGYVWDQSHIDTLLINTIDRIIETKNVNQQKIFITGYSIGSVGTWYYTLNHSDIFAASIPMAGFARYINSESNINIPVYAIHSKSDNVYEFETVRNLVKGLKSNNKPVELDSLENVEHGEFTKFLTPLTNKIEWLNTIK